MLGRQPLEDRNEAVGRLVVQRIETEDGRVGARLFRLKPLQRSLDGRLVGGGRQGHDAARLRVDAQPRVRYQARKQRERRRRIGLGQPINLQLGRRGRRVPVCARCSPRPCGPWPTLSAYPRPQASGSSGRPSAGRWGRAFAGPRGKPWCERPRRRRRSGTSRTGAGLPPRSRWQPARPRP